MRMNNQELEWGVILLELNLFILKFVNQQYIFFQQYTLLLGGQRV